MTDEIRFTTKEEDEIVKRANNPILDALSRLEDLELDQ